MAQPGGLRHKNRPFMMRKRTVYDPQPGGLRIANRQASIRGQAGCASRLSVYIKKTGRLYKQIRRFASCKPPDLSIRMIVFAAPTAMPCAIKRQLHCGNAGDLLHNDGLVLRHKSLHDYPTDKVSHSTDAEHNHVSGRFAVKTHERKGCALPFGVGEEDA